MHHAIRVFFFNKFVLAYLYARHYYQTSLTILQNYGYWLTSTTTPPVRIRNVEITWIKHRRLLSNASVNVTKSFVDLWRSKDFAPLEYTGAALAGVLLGYEVPHRFFLTVYYSLPHGNLGIYRDYRISYDHNSLICWPAPTQTPRQDIAYAEAVQDRSATDVTKIVQELAGPGNILWNVPGGRLIDSFISGNLDMYTGKLDVYYLDGQIESFLMCDV